MSTLQEIQGDVALTFQGIEVKARAVKRDIETIQATMVEDVAQEHSQKKSDEFKAEVSKKYDRLGKRLQDYEPELEARKRAAYHPHLTSGEDSKVIIAQNFDQRAETLVSKSGKDPKPVINEIRKNGISVDYISSLIEWSRFTWGEGPRSPLGLDFGRLVEEFEKRIGITAMSEEEVKLEDMRRQIKSRKEMAKADLYKVEAEDEKEAERMGLTLEHYLEIKVDRLLRQRERESATV